MLFGGEIERFNKFKKIAKATELDERLHLEIIEREIFIQNPVLILVDIGGSLMYRHGSS
jgi:hypothetical protein